MRAVRSADASAVLALVLSADVRTALPPQDGCHGVERALPTWTVGHHRAGGNLNRETAPPGRLLDDPAEPRGDEFAPLARIPDLSKGRQDRLAPVDVVSFH